MDIANTFSDQVIKAVTAKTKWYDEREMEKIVEQFRTLHTCVQSLFDSLVKKGLIKKDPYKLDKKIVDVVPMEDEEFSDNERNLVIGMRFSDYESMLEYVCNYYKFSVSHLTIAEIKKLVAMVNSFLWTSFNVNNQKVNTRGLATIIFNFRQNTEAMTAALITDSLQKAAKATTLIMSMLKDLSDFQREVYKANIRQDIFTHPNFKESDAASSDVELKQIKTLFAQVMGKIPFYSELIDEIIAEDHGDNKEKIRAALLKKLSVEGIKTIEKKEKEVDTKEPILAAVRVLGGLSGQMKSCLEKISENHDVLESEHNSFKDKLVKAFKKAFGIKPKPVVYQVVIVDQSTDTHQKKNIDYLIFIENLDRLMRRCVSVGNKGSGGYAKISAMEESKILEFVTQQITEVNKLLILLNALDAYFKNTASTMNKSKIKGMKMEMTAMKNTIVKANQVRAEYVAHIEEEAQMKKLGIEN